jgi:hypothetical protein
MTAIRRSGPPCGNVISLDATRCGAILRGTSLGVEAHWAARASCQIAIENGRDVQVGRATPGK